jgi:acetylornithine deacetylase/succinyl-diaminopimelate desuccinylase-like protein
MPEDDLVLSQIDVEELARLALDLGNIDSPSGQEKPVADFVENWLRREGFKTDVLALFPERPNVVGTYRGTGGGYSLLFNSHMDTSVSGQDVWIYRDPLKAIDHQAWREGDMLYGNGVVNDKGLMACFMVAAKAIKKAGISLRGDLVLTAVSGEIELEPVDEFQPPQYLGHEVGTRYIVTHGVIADYVLVAENTQFGFGPLEAGRAIFKVTLLAGPSLYTPYVNRPYPLEKNPNAIVQMGKLVEEIEEWAVEYEKTYTYTSRAGTIVPKVNVGAIRGGAPYFPAVTPEVCSIYVDVRTIPGQDVLSVKADLERVIHAIGLKGEVDLFLYQCGYEAKNIDRLREAIKTAHRRVFNEDVKMVTGPRASMWRDTNIFNEVGIPAASYGPGGGKGGGGQIGLSLDDLHRASQVYAMVALDICNREKRPPDKM